MKFQAILFVTLGGLILGAPPKAEQEKKALQKLEGKWILLKGEHEGKKLSKETCKDSSLVIKGNKHFVLVGDEKILGTHTVDPTKNPKTMDSTYTEGPLKGKTAFGIYKIKKNKFTVCFAPPGKDRPTEFTTKTGTGVLYHVWKRKKE